MSPVGAPINLISLFLFTANDSRETTVGIDWNIFTMYVTRLIRVLSYLTKSLGILFYITKSLEL